MCMLVAKYGKLSSFSSGVNRIRYLIVGIFHSLFSWPSLWLVFIYIIEDDCLIPLLLLLLSLCYTNAARPRCWRAILMLCRCFKKCDVSIGWEGLAHHQQMKIVFVLLPNCTHTHTHTRVFVLWHLMKLSHCTACLANGGSPQMVNFICFIWWWQLWTCPVGDDYLSSDDGFHLSMAVLSVRTMYLYQVNTIQCNIVLIEFISSEVAHHLYKDY